MLIRINTETHLNPVEFSSGNSLKIIYDEFKPEKAVYVYNLPPIIPGRLYYNLIRTIVNKTTHDFKTPEELKQIKPTLISSGCQMQVGGLTSSVKNE